jgi:hypothetical protein
VSLEDYTRVVAKRRVILRGRIGHRAALIAGNRLSLGREQRMDNSAQTESEGGSTSVPLVEPLVER